MSMISQAAKRLKTLLATTAGAAQVGFDAGVAYAAGTVGDKLKSLSQSITTLSGQIAGILDGADFTGPVKLPGNASDNLHAVPLQQVTAIAEAAAGLAATGVEVGRLLRVERFKVSGTFTKQVGDRLIEAVLIGAGGGGGGANGTGGGGAGSTVLKVFQAADLAASEPVTVGTGGTTGLDGTFSKFSTAQANGGGAGVNNLGGAGGGGGVGDLLINGGSGGAGVPAGKFSDATFRIFGHGGNSSIGGGASGQATNANSGDNGAPNTGGGGMGSGGGGSGYVELRIYS